MALRVDFVFPLHKNGSGVCFQYLYWGTDSNGGWDCLGFLYPGEGISQGSRGEAVLTCCPTIFLWEQGCFLTLFFSRPRIIELNGNKPPLTYKRFQAIISRMELPKKPVSSITSQQMEKCKAEIQENHDDVYGVPSLEELGM